MTRAPSTSDATERQRGERAVAGEPAKVLPPSPAARAAVSPASSPAVARAAAPTDRLHFLEALVGVAGAINATLELDKVLQLLVDKAADLLQVPAASVMLVDEKGEVRVRASRGLTAAYVESQRQPLEQSVAGRALAEGRIFAAWDVRKSPEFGAAAAATQEGISSVACAPMLFGGKPVGALNLYCRDPHCFTDDQFHVLSLLAAQGAVAITNARLYRDSRTQAGEVRASFQRVGTALASSLDRTEILQLIVQLAVEMTRAEGGAVFMLADEREGGGMILSGSRGLYRPAVKRFRRMPLSPLAERAFAERRVIAVPDTRRYPNIAFPALHLSGEGTDVSHETRSVVCVPIVAGGRPVGVLEQYAREPGRFGREEIQLLSSFALQAAVAIENARLYAQEHNVAQTLQRAFLPELPDTVDSFQIGRIYAPANEMSSVGGDTYDLFPVSEGRIAAVIADVCGKGAAAATIAVLAKYTIRAYALEDPDPARVVARINDALVPQTDDSTFLTLCYALFDPASRRVTIANAAHPPVLLWRRADGRCRPVGPQGGMIAGFRPGETYPSESVAVEPGDVLVFYTDGVIEARKRKAMFQAKALQSVIEKNAGGSAQDIAAAIYAAVVDFTSGNLSDDIALLVLKAK